MSAMPLTPVDLALAALLLAVNGALSVALGLGLERNLAVAAVRMVVQLCAVGLVFGFVLAQTSPAWTALAVLAMVLVAGQELLWHRHGHPRLRWLTYGLGNVTLLLVGALATLYAAALVAAPASAPWYAPRTVLPIMGLVLGAMLTSVGLALQTLTEGAERERAAIDARIALGAGRFTAFSGVLKSAVRTATTPVMATIATAGVTTLPGLMAGQVMAGVDPADAAKAQIVVMLVLAGAAGLGALAAAFGSILLLTDTRHRLRLDRAA
jgi:putative ABC transport system permease protein